ncbi:myosin-IIIb-like isoform X1 [Branchiostoma floridae x Branchiostoma belcheri]
MMFKTSRIDFSSLPDPTPVWELVDNIGVGTYGEVYKVQHKKTGEIAAAKIMEEVTDIDEEIDAEYQILCQHSNHNNITRFYGMYYAKGERNNSGQLWLVMELCTGGSVTDLVRGMLKRKEKMEEGVIAYILREALMGVGHLHKHHIMHRDVKGSNILLTEEANIKLVDFGVSAQVSHTRERRNTSVGTPYWMAPEVIACEQQLDYNYDMRCDTWSVGITAIELADGEPPLADLHPMRALFKIPRNPPSSMKQPEMWSTTYRDFVARCLVKDFELRPSVAELLKHPFLTQIGDDTSVVRKQLLDQMEINVRLGKVQPHVPVTTKHGLFKSCRRKTRMYFVDDLATLEALDEDIIVEHLHQRYKREQIYTYVGDILIAVNPFQDLGMYTDEYSEVYRGAAKQDNPPHIFAIADAAYQAMVHHKHNQLMANSVQDRPWHGMGRRHGTQPNHHCLVISGESGAGKTVSANLLVQQLTQLGKASNRALERKVLQVNPLLEAFGNAQTAINDNSSRFGKYLEMIFTGAGAVTGAQLSEYLLEKSRVVSQAPGESNFHIFYYIFAGLARKDGYLLEPTNTYRYLSNDVGSMAAIAQDPNNRERFDAIHECLETIGFSGEEIHSVYSILAGILHVGNIEFANADYEHTTANSYVVNPKTLNKASTLLAVNPDELRDALTTHSVVARGETIVRYNTVDEAKDVRDAMAKALYGRLFDWIVNKINTLLRPNKDNGVETCVIGILDIFGFENFKRNSFEQLCINIANEQLQYYFNQHIFAWEQAEYKQEGIEASAVTYEDNRPLLNMFLGKPLGMLALLDEESRFPQASDQSLVEKFNKHISSQYHWTPKGSGLVFGVQHYAGKVVYDAKDFLEKNRDYLAPDVVLLLRQSERKLIRSLFLNPLTKTGNLANTRGSNGTSGQPRVSHVRIRPINASNSKNNTTELLSPEDSVGRTQQTVALYFRYSLMDLLQKMETGMPMFVRCIKPNNDKIPGQFDIEKVLIQLRYTGVLETTRIRREGYSHRIAFQDFVRRYAMVAYSPGKEVPPSKQTCQQILQNCQMENWRLGKTKVFLKYYHVEQLTRQVEQVHHRIVLVQAQVRRWLHMRRYRRYRQQKNSSVLLLQRVVRGWLVRRKYQTTVRQRQTAAVTIQKAYRGYRARRRYTSELSQRKHSAVVLQSIIRGFLARKQLQRQRAESVWKKIMDRREYAVLIMQKTVRMWLSKRQYQQLMQQNGRKDIQRIYFMQQVEEYGQQAMANQQRLNSPVFQDDISEQRLRTESDVSERLPLERSRHVKRGGAAVKSPWSLQDVAYYENVTSENDGHNYRRKMSKTGQMKQVVSPQDDEYYHNLKNNVQSEERKPIVVKQLIIMKPTDQPLPIPNHQQKTSITSRSPPNTPSSPEPAPVPVPVPNPIQQQIAQAAANKPVLRKVQQAVAKQNGTSEPVIFDFRGKLRKTGIPLTPHPAEESNAVVQHDFRGNLRKTSPEGNIRPMQEVA